MTETIVSDPKMAAHLHDRIFMPVLLEATRKALDVEKAQMIDTINALANAYTDILAGMVGPEHVAGLMREHAAHLEKEQLKSKN